MFGSRFMGDFEMPSILDIVDAKGRLNYKQLKDFVGGLSIAEFTDQAKHPFLVGKELYDGEIMSRPPNASASITMRFQAVDMRRNLERANIQLPHSYSPAVRAHSDTHPSAPIPPQAQGANAKPAQPQEGGGLSQAIFIVRRKLYSTQPENVIGIGRAASNDIVVADYVISKTHAQIILFKGMYFIVDLGSTNGTKVNHQSISPGAKVQLQFNDSVSFGRIVFVFTNPLSVYSGLRKEILGI